MKVKGKLCSVINNKSASCTGNNSSFIDRIEGIIKRHAAKLSGPQVSERGPDASRTIIRLFHLTCSFEPPDSPFAFPRFSALKTPI